MFRIIPCVDVQDGHAVRLTEGDPERSTIYHATPLEAARRWVDAGAELLHLVDLDAALGVGDNRQAIREVAQRLPVRTEVGGGIRDEATADAWLALVDRVVIGTAAVTQPELVETLLRRYGPKRVVVSVDARHGRVAVRGWQETSEIDAVALARSMAERGVRELIYTDVTRDGTMQGVDMEPVAQVREAFPHSLIAGGGVGSDADLDLYKRLGLQGAIVGRALYEGTVRYPREG